MEPSETMETMRETFSSFFFPHLKKSRRCFGLWRTRSHLFPSDQCSTFLRSSYVATRTRRPWCVRFDAKSTSMRRPPWSV